MRKHITLFFALSLLLILGACGGKDDGQADPCGLNIRCRKSPIPAGVGTFLPKIGAGKHYKTNFALFFALLLALALAGCGNSEQEDGICKYVLICSD